MQQMIQLLAGERKFTGTQGSGLVLGPTCSAKGGSQVETSWFWSPGLALVPGLLLSSLR